ncbi:hypothetical protein EGW08_008066 [Elysia chlorotica]|uniref:Uncharacterized protein n=1 Tax=Elysia chlorotica TaxID=188477 RepID=A0A3S1C6C3_ELYCH|nr:hypothetical protein EGW08_008066 [Elysia chlorotica]
MSSSSSSASDLSSSIFGLSFASGDLNDFFLSFHPRGNSPDRLSESESESSPEPSTFFLILLSLSSSVSSELLSSSPSRKRSTSLSMDTSSSSEKEQMGFTVASSLVLLTSSDLDATDESVTFCFFTAPS